MTVPYRFLHRNRPIWFKKALDVVSITHLEFFFDIEPEKFAGFVQGY